MASAISVSVLVKKMARETVFAARSGESVVVITERRERMKTMKSRFHNGQFCFYSSATFSCSFKSGGAKQIERERVRGGHWGRLKVAGREVSFPSCRTLGSRRAVVHAPLYLYHPRRLKRCLYDPISRFAPLYICGDSKAHQGRAPASDLRGYRGPLSRISITSWLS